MQDFFNSISGFKVNDYKNKQNAKISQEEKETFKNVDFCINKHSEKNDRMA